MITAGGMSFLSPYIKMVLNRKGVDQEETERAFKIPIYSS